MWVTQARGTVWAPGPSRPPTSPASWCHPLPEPQAAGTGSLPEGTGPVVCSGRCVGREASQGGTALTQRGSVDAHRPAVPARRGSQAPSQDRTAGPRVPIASLDCPACAAESGGWGTPGFLSSAQESVPADSAMALLPGFQSRAALTTTPGPAHTARRPPPAPQCLWGDRGVGGSQRGTRD